MLERAGEYLDYIAIHMMGQRPTRRDTVLRGLRYQSEPRQAWEELLEMTKLTEARVLALESILASKRSSAGLAITEGHLSLSPHNANPILHEWLTGVIHARTMNIYQRHGARVKIATAADFCGSRWTVNAVMLQVPRGVTYLMPAGSVMRLFRKYNGTHGLAVKSAPPSLDIAASRAGDRFFLHIANTNYTNAVQASFAIDGLRILDGAVHQIAPGDPREYVNQDRPHIFTPKDTPLTGPHGFEWRFPARSVSAVELRCAG
jgi:hypothetical protein